MCWSPISNIYILYIDVDSKHLQLRPMWIKTRRLTAPIEDGGGVAIPEIVLAETCQAYKFQGIFPLHSQYVLNEVRFLDDPEDLNFHLVETYMIS